MVAKKEAQTARPGAFRGNEGTTMMRTSLWILNGIVIAVLAFFVGYAASDKTGIEPGYFAAAETGGYGGGAGSTAGGAGDLSEDMQQYYKELTE